MIVRCVANSRESLENSAFLENYKAYVRLEGVNLMIGFHYIVCGIGYRKGVPWFLVCEEPDSEYPKPHLSAFFEIVDPRIPPNWAFRMGRGVFGESEILPVSWVKDLGFPGRLVDGEREAVVAFRELQRELALWHGEGSVSLPGIPAWLFKDPAAPAEIDEE